MYSGKFYRSFPAGLTLLSCKWKQYIPTKCRLFLQVTWRHSSEDSIRLNYRSENLRSRSAILIFVIFLKYLKSVHTFCSIWTKQNKTKQTSWPEPASELYRPSDSRLSVKLAPTFADRGCHVVSVTDPYGRILGSPYRSRYYFFQVAPQLYPRGWVDLVPDPLLLRKSGSAGNQNGPLDM
jgi:hypothetical protein